MAAKTKRAKGAKKSAKAKKLPKASKAAKLKSAKAVEKISAKAPAVTKKPAKSAAAKRGTAEVPALRRAATPARRAAAATKTAARARARTRAAAVKTDPIKLYYWPTPNGWKITIALEEMGLPYQMIPVDITQGDQFKPAFLKIAPNNRMPAILDPKGPGGKPISVFESGAILQYLARKTGRFYPKTERRRVEVDEWLFWQMGGLGPMAGQAHHFRQYAPKRIPYASKRYTDEVNRLYGVMNKRLARRHYLAGDYSIADMACLGWVIPHKNQGQKLEDFPHLKRWFERMQARPAVQRGLAVGQELRRKASSIKTDTKARAVLFGQRAR